MARFGISLLILGLAGMVLPMFDLQLQILSFLDYDTQFFASAALMVIGLVLILIPVIARTRKRDKQSQGYE
jgi:uncharacterized membrane protein